MTEYSIDILRITRENILKDINRLSLKEIQKIPEGCSNNILWNVAHLVATQQILLYKLSGVPFRVPGNLVEQFRKGTRPSSILSQESWEEIKDLFLSTIDQLELDIETKYVGDSFKAYQTSFGVSINKLEDALLFNNIHEGMHYGTIKVLIKLL